MFDGMIGPDYEKGLELRRKINELLLTADKKKYRLKWDGHFAAHFGIIGFTTTPVSDGKYVYAFFGSRGMYCYDFKGNLIWEKDFGVRMQIKMAFGEGMAPVLADERFPTRVRTSPFTSQRVSVI